MRQVLSLDYEASKQLQYYICYAERIKDFVSEDSLYYYLLGDRSQEKSRSFRYDAIEAEIINSHYVAQNARYLYSLLPIYDEVRFHPLSTAQNPRIETLSNKIIDGTGLTYICNKKEKLSLPNRESIDYAIGIMRIHRKDINKYYMQDEVFQRHLPQSISDYELEQYFELRLYADIYKKKGLGSSLKTSLGISGLGSNSFMRAMLRDETDIVFTTKMKYLDRIFFSIVDSQKQKNSSYYSPVFKYSGINTISPDLCKAIDNYMIRVDFTNGLHIIPNPKTLADVMELRENPDLISFRNIFGRWIGYLVNGDFSAFEKMKDDVEKSNKALEKLSKFRKVDSSWYSRVFTAVGGDIPYISLILNGYGLVMPYITDRIEQKHRWVQLPAFNHDIKFFL